MLNSCFLGKFFFSKFISFCIKSLLAEVFFLLLSNDVIELIPGDNENYFSLHLLICTGTLEVLYP